MMAMASSAHATHEQAIMPTPSTQMQQAAEPSQAHLAETDPPSSQTTLKPDENEVLESLKTTEGMAGAVTQAKNSPTT